MIGMLTMIAFALAVALVPRDALAYVAKEPPMTKHVAPKPIDLRDVVDEARELAERTRDPVHFVAARVLDSIELVLRRHRAGTLTEADGKILSSIEKKAWKIGGTRSRDERWTGQNLAARPNVDRADRVREALATITQVVLSPTSKSQIAGETRHPSKAALILVSVVWKAKLVDTTGRKRADDIEAARGALEAAAKKSAPVKLDAEALLVLALKACGVSQVDARNMARDSSQ